MTVVVIYTNKATGKTIESDDDRTCEEILELLRTLTVPGSTLITKFPSGMGLDFHVEADGRLWVEFYANELSGAIVTMFVAEEIVQRAFQGVSGKIKENYRDLILEWQY